MAFAADERRATMKTLLAALAFSLVAIAAGCSPAVSEEINGKASVLDGDTLEIAAQRIRLFGIDAPETGQRCNLRTDKTWPCGADASKALRSMVQGNELRCEGERRDDYGRLLARCYVGPLFVNEEMVRSGMAWAFVKYSRDFVAIEDQAKKSGAGIWKAATPTAWEYRASRWKVAEVTAPNGCPIKGNVTSKGERIYHPPWSPWYDKINMKDTSKGKRWFCSEEEAITAGWRSAIWQ